MQTDDLDDDFVLSDGPGYKAAMCSKCGAIKPIAEFQRRMSKAYAQAKGKAGGMGMLVESSMCRSCQPKPKPVKELSAKELHNRTVSGDLHARVVEEIMAERKAKASAAARTGIKTAWNALRATYWEGQLFGLKHETLRVQQQEKYALKNTDLDTAFFVEYKLLLRLVKARIVHEQRTKSGHKDFLPKSKDWQGWAEPDEWQKIQALWYAMPSDYLTVAKPPALLAIHPEDAQPYKPHATTLRRTPPPAERLNFVPPLPKPGENRTPRRSDPKEWDIDLSKPE